MVVGAWALLRVLAVDVAALVDVLARAIVPLALAVKAVLAAVLGFAVEPPRGALDIPLVLDVGLVLLVDALEDLIGVRRKARCIPLTALATALALALGLLRLRGRRVMGDAWLVPRLRRSRGIVLFHAGGGLDLELGAPALVQKVLAGIAPRIPNALLALLKELHDLLDEAVEEVAELVQRHLARPGRIDHETLELVEEPLQVIPGEEDVGLGDEMRVHEVAHDELGDQVQQEAAAEDLECREVRLIFLVIAGELQITLKLLPRVALGIFARLALAVEPDERIVILLDVGLHLLELRRFILALLVVVARTAQVHATRLVVVIDVPILDAQNGLHGAIHLIRG